VKKERQPVFHHHPKRGDKGEKVYVKKPTLASDPSTWTNSKTTATFLPEGNFPKALHGIPFASWKAPVTKQGLNYVEGINRNIAEEPMQVPKGKHAGAGVIVEEDDGRIWLVTPTNAFGGYQNTFPKGTCEEGLSMQANALKEAWEECGLQVKITGVVGDFERTTSMARIYTAKRIGGNPIDMGWESQAVRLVPRDQLEEFLNMIPDKNIIKTYLSRKKE
jgi:ADP-ribose pyrophosphatase YjhB (NUDIX family)